MISLDLDELLAETPAAAARRADEAFAGAVGDRPIVLYGAGGHGRRVLAALRDAGVEPVCFADASAAAPGRTVDGLDVLSLQDAAARHGDSAAFVVCVFNPKAGHEGIRAALTAAGCRLVVSWVVLAWRHADRLLPLYAAGRPEHVLEQADAVRAAHALLSDAASREEYVRQVAWRLHADFGPLSAPEPADAQYFSPGLVTLRPDERFVDCGAYDGDTLRAFLAHADRGFETFLALEPDPANLDLLEAVVAELPGDQRRRVRTLPYAVADSAGTVRFAAGDGAGAAISETGGVEVETVALDALLEDEPPPTYVKMDIEGAELAALAGAARTIAAARPLLAVCAYHEQDHLWRVPLAIAELAEDYRLALRRYEHDVFDLVAYALPPGRA